MWFKCSLLLAIVFFAKAPNASAENDPKTDFIILKYEYRVAMGVTRYEAHVSFQPGEILFDVKRWNLDPEHNEVLDMNYRMKRLTGETTNPTFVEGLVKSVKFMAQNEVKSWTGLDGEFYTIELHMPDKMYLVKIPQQESPYSSAALEEIYAFSSWIYKSTGVYPRPDSPSVIGCSLASNPQECLKGVECVKGVGPED